MLGHGTVLCEILCSPEQPALLAALEERVVDNWTLGALVSPGIEHVSKCLGRQGAKTLSHWTTQRK